MVKISEGLAKAIEETYTEEQLKRAFECGNSVGVGMCMENKSSGDILKLLVDTPIDVHKTNMSLAVWQWADWQEALNWILNPAPPSMGKEKYRAEQLRWNGSAVEPKSSIVSGCDPASN